MITTGGTIAGNVASDRQDGMVDQADFINIFARAINYLNCHRNMSIEINARTLCNIDSSDIMPEHWADIARVIKEEYDNYDAFIITHGTNTLGYTSAALSFALANPKKPIIITGSQVSAALPGSDGQINLENALRIATWMNEDGLPLRGVVAVFGSHIISGTRVKKDTEFDYDAFTSFGTGSIGRIGRIININEMNLRRHLKYLKSGTYTEAARASDLICDSDFDMRIGSLSEFPGMSSDILKTLIEHNDVKGIILRAFGAGDPSTRHRAAFEYLKDREVPIVVTTQAPNGNSNFQVNNPGRMLRNNNLAIPAYDMCIESQTVKLAWLLAKRRRGELNYSQICREMVHDIRGEINVMLEIMT